MNTPAKKVAAKKAGARVSRIESPTTSEVSPVSDWKQLPEPTELPSGKFVRVRKTAFQTFIRMGVVPNSLISTIESSLAKGNTADLEAEAVGNLEEMFELVDTVTLLCVIEPKVHKVPEREVDDDGNPTREDDRLYVDEIDPEDRQYIFQYATGGIADVEQFRRETQERLASLQPSANVALPS